RIESSFVVEPLPARLAGTRTLSKTGTGVFGVDLFQLPHGKVIEADVVLHWGEGRGLADVIARLPAERALIALVFTTLEATEWPAVCAARRETTVVDSGFIWKLAGRSRNSEGAAKVIDFPERRRVGETASEDAPAATPSIKGGAVLPDALRPARPCSG